MIKSDDNLRDINLSKSSNHVLLNKRSKVIRIKKLLKERDSKVIFN